MIERLEGQEVHELCSELREMFGDLAYPNVRWLSSNKDPYIEVNSKQHGFSMSIHFWSRINSIDVVANFYNLADVEDYFEDWILAHGYRQTSNSNCPKFWTKERPSELSLQAKLLKRAVQDPRAPWEQEKIRMVQELADCLQQDYVVETRFHGPKGVSDLVAVFDKDGTYLLTVGFMIRLNFDDDYYLRATLHTGDVDDLKEFAQDWLLTQGFTIQGQEYIKTEL